MVPFQGVNSPSLRVYLAPLLKVLENLYNHIMYVSTKQTLAPQGFK